VPGWESRLAAADMLSHVLDGRVTLDEALESSAPYSNLAGSDRGFARAMVSSALRRLGHIDAGLSSLIDRPLETANPLARALLRVGAAQLWDLDVPVHAVVSATVEAARRGRQEPSTRFINAVLRRADAPEAREGVAALPPEKVWPDWLRWRLGAALGAEATRALAAAQLETPDLDLCLKDPATREALIDALLAANVDARALGPNTVRVQGAPPALDALPGFADGQWWVQDLAASLPVQLLAPKPGERVVDLCAAPGGKTLQLAAGGAEVTAVDLNPERLERVAENLARVGLTARMVASDGRTFSPEMPVDAVLLDAPCAAFGTLRRNPEGAWIKPTDIDQGLIPVQRQLLAAAHRMLPPGGRCVYAVCSPLPEEGPGIVEPALREGTWRPGTWQVGPALRRVMPGDLAPVHDAFFIACLEKA